MRILLVHNPKAGSEEHEGEDFIKALKRAGHKATYQSSKKKGIMKALKKKIDLVLVAGGDGTVSKVARRLVAMDSEIPLAVLPMGTANNFARSLGFCLSEKELIEQLNHGKCNTFDVGQARGPCLTLAADAKTNDGSFDFVGAREEDRALLLDYFDARVAGKRRKFPLRPKRLTKMRLRWTKWPLHFDDELWPAEGEKPPKQCEIELIVKNAALRIWR